MYKCFNFYCVCMHYNNSSNSAFREALGIFNATSSKRRSLFTYVFSFRLFGHNSYCFLINFWFRLKDENLDFNLLTTWQNDRKPWQNDRKSRQYDRKHVERNPEPGQYLLQWHDLPPQCNHDPPLLLPSQLQGLLEVKGEKRRTENYSVFNKTSLSNSSTIFQEKVKFFKSLSPFSKKITSSCCSAFFYSCMMAPFF